MLALPNKSMFDWDTSSPMPLIKHNCSLRFTRWTGYIPYGEEQKMYCNMDVTTQFRGCTVLLEDHRLGGRLTAW